MTDRLRVAIVHYHLRRGGVSRVIEHAVQALSDQGIASAVLAGEAGAEGLSIPNVVVREELGYADAPPAGVSGLLAEIRTAATTALGGKPDIWHFHNHSLGKNYVQPALVHGLAEEGDRLVLQIHDFAEDGRPELYRGLLHHVGNGDEERLGEVLYPCVPHVHYAALTDRDRVFLVGAGASEQSVYLLPNAAGGTEVTGAYADSDGERSPFFLYPARAIRRKNIGEFILWAALAGNGERFGISLPPENPVVRPVYDRWVAFASEAGIAVEFEMGVRQAFDALLAEATVLVTTSVAEGFGLAFLEPWLAGRPLVGRNLPDITAGFSGAGVDLEHLYERLWVPLERVGRDRLAERMIEALRSSFSAYGRELQCEITERAVASGIKEDAVDFGKLDEPMQEEVIRQAIKSPNSLSRISPSSLNVADARARIPSNQEAVRGAFGIEQYGERLRRMYEGVLEGDAKATSRLSIRALVDRFMDPDRFTLLRT